MTTTMSKKIVEIDLSSIVSNHEETIRDDGEELRIEFPSERVKDNQNTNGNSRTEEESRIPDWLNGTIYTTAPAKFELDR